MTRIFKSFREARGNTRSDFRQRGYSLVEVMISIAIGGLLLTSMSGLLDNAMKSHAFVREQNDLARQAHFAMGRIEYVVRHAPRLQLPFVDDPNSNPLQENIRDLLAVALSLDMDLDGDGIPDADNDGDGAIDEDLPADTNNDGKPGIRGIDDDGNGIKDHSWSPSADDDESNDLKQSEDWINGIDDDGDGGIDEDPPADMNNDSEPGLAGVDDDADGFIDEGNTDDDDEDGQIDEDWYDFVVIYLDVANDTLIERTPVPWDVTGDSSVTGHDYLESPIAENVTEFRVERYPQGASNNVLLDITLELTDSSGEIVKLQSQLRVGSAL